MGPEDVLRFWFGEEDAWREEWFTKSEDFDREIRDRFETLYESAASGTLDDWRESAEGALALVIVLDQFPRNMFRGDPKCYATDEKALATAKHALDRALDRELPPTRRSFLYMPFMHCEDLEDQRRSVELFRSLDSGESAAYAVRHMEIVERFGRFPHRNEVLGRATTSEEAEFLKEPGSSF
ncbi:MAG TPA: DUF924 family protein [Rubrobacteraceae bacterium]|nr:DUF924 family protein [Rubrobacteraceae bacterium]